MASKKVYAVRRGRACGIFTSWDECQKQVTGYAGAQFKGFTDVREALAWLNGGHTRATLPDRQTASTGRSTAHGTSPYARRHTVSAGAAASRTSDSHTAAATTLSDDAQDYVIFTDGSCLRNPNGPGGWAAVVRCVATGEVTELSGGDPGTTNNRMELTAAIKGLSFPPAPAKIALYTDSQYLKNGFTRHWVAAWKRRGWRKADGSPVLNQPLWQQLDELFSRHQVTFHWVKGHAGNPLNERCDELARTAAMHSRD